MPKDYNQLNKKLFYQKRTMHCSNGVFLGPNKKILKLFRDFRALYLGKFQNKMAL